MTPCLPQGDRVVGFEVVVGPAHDDTLAGLDDTDRLWGGYGNGRLCCAGSPTTNVKVPQQLLASLRVHQANRDPAFRR